MATLRLGEWQTAAPAPQLPAEAFGLLNYLRFVALDCRAKPRTDLFEACALLHATKDRTQQTHAEALMRCIGQALGKPARLYAPGVIEVTFDENWLTQLGLASARQDTASVRFLIQSRVSQEHQRLVGYLVHQISKHDISI